MYGPGFKIFEFQLFQIFCKKKQSQSVVRTKDTLFGQWGYSKKDKQKETNHCRLHNWWVPHLVVMSLQPFERTFAQISRQVAVGLGPIGTVPSCGSQGLHQLLCCPLAVFTGQPGRQDTCCQRISQLQGTHSGTQVG